MEVINPGKKRQLSGQGHNATPRKMNRFLLLLRTVGLTMNTHNSLPGQEGTSTRNTIMVNKTSTGLSEKFSLRVELLHRATRPEQEVGSKYPPPRKSKVVEILNKISLHSSWFLGSFFLLDGEDCLPREKRLWDQESNMRGKMISSNNPLES